MTNGFDNLAQPIASKKKLYSLSKQVVECNIRLVNKEMILNIRQAVEYIMIGEIGSAREKLDR